MPHVRRTGAVEGLMEQSQMFKEINCLKNCLIHLGQGQVLTLPEGKSCVSLSLSLCSSHFPADSTSFRRLPVTLLLPRWKKKRREHGEDQLYLRPRTLREADSAAYNCPDEVTHTMASVLSLCCTYSSSRLTSSLQHPSPMFPKAGRDTSRNTDPLMPKAF